MRVRVEPRSGDCDHTVAVTTAKIFAKTEQERSRSQIFGVGVDSDYKNLDSDMTASER